MPHLLFVLALFLASNAAAGEVFRCTERDGTRGYYAQRPVQATCDVASTWQERDPANVDAEVLPVQRMPVKPARIPAPVVPHASLENTIRHHAQRWNVDESLVRAVIHAESSYNPRAVSPKGAMGLMQLMPSTARRFGVLNAFDPEQNVAGGVQYLAWLLNRYKGDWRLAVAGYNAGEGAVDKYAGVPPYRETRAYLVKVWNLSQSYRRAQRK